MFRRSATIGFDIELKHGDLWITGERTEEKEEKGKTWHRKERYYGEFRRMIRLGDDVDPERVDAEYKDGVLKVTVVKTEGALRDLMHHDLSCIALFHSSLPSQS